MALTASNEGRSGTTVHRLFSIRVAKVATGIIPPPDLASRATAGRIMMLPLREVARQGAPKRGRHC